MKRRECKSCGLTDGNPTGVVIKRYFETHCFSGIPAKGVTFVVRCTCCGRAWRYHKKAKTN